MLLGHRLLSYNRKQIPPPRLVLPFLTLSVVGYFPYCSFLRFPAVGAIKPLSLLVLRWPFLVRFNKSSTYLYPASRASSVLSFFSFGALLLMRTRITKFFAFLRIYLLVYEVYCTRNVIQQELRNGMAPLAAMPR